MLGKTVMLTDLSPRREVRYGRNLKFCLMPERDEEFLLLS